MNASYKLSFVLNERYVMHKKPYNKPRGGGRNSGGRGNSRRKKAIINPERFINKNTIKAEDQGSQFDESVNFADFNLDEKIQRNLRRAGFVHPSQIQNMAIPPALEGTDVIGLANTGTGKTIAFLLPILNALLHEKQNNPEVLDLSEGSNNRKPGRKSALILAPTRELAQQINDEFRKFSEKTGIYSALLVGGMNIGAQFRELRRKPQVIIGTPGRVMDHIKRGSLNLSSISFFVLDEADRMLDMGFVNDIKEIAASLSDDKQTFCFSATFNDQVKSITNGFMKDPVLVSAIVNQTSDHIYQDVVRYEGKDNKKDQLIEILETEAADKVIIFGETKFGVQRLSDELDKHGIRTKAIHGDKNQAQRNRAIKSFKNNEVDVLVATDVAARGLDIPNVSHVINYETPQSYDDYVHRIGRTGRGGKTGIALTFVPEKQAEVQAANNPRRRYKKPARMNGQSSGKNYRSNRDRRD